MASTIIAPVAQALQTKIAGLGLATTVAGHLWAPAMLPTRPCGVVELPTLGRTDPLEAESEIGRDDWEMEFPVVFYFDLTEPIATQTLAVEVVEAFIQAVDADPSLGIVSIADDASVVSVGPPEVIDDQANALIRYPAVVRLTRLV